MRDPAAATAERAALSDSPMVELRAGALTLDFEPHSGALRNIRWRDLEVLRGIYGAVRDADWNTLANNVEALEVNAFLDSFAVSFQVTCINSYIDFRWRGCINGTADGAVVFTMEGEAKREFLRNRIGLCVLHPALTCEGRPCQIESVDKAVYFSQFPRLIDPRQPFRQVRALSYPIADDWWLRTECKGDVFETEDQRNWSDASFKTYSTPLDLPFPAPVRAGTRVWQQVTVSLVQREPVGTYVPPVHHHADRQEELAWRPPVELPGLGTCLNVPHASLTDLQLERVRALQLNHLRIDLQAAHDGCVQEYVETRSMANQIGAALHVAMHGPGELVLARRGELTALDAIARNSGESRVNAWLLFNDGDLVATASTLAAARKLPGAQGRLAIGTNAYLAELNRDRPVANSADWVVFSLNPQVHARDTRTIVESLEVQSRMIETVRDFCGSSRVMVSPITLRPRFNPVATTSSAAGMATAAEAEADPRHLTSFAAAWTLASIVQLARGGAGCATYFELLGPRGILLNDGPAESTPCVTPIYHVLADLADLRQLGGGVLRSLGCGSGLGSVEGLWSRKGEQAVLLLAHLSPTPRQITLPNEALRSAAHQRVRILDESTLSWACNSPTAFRADMWRDLSDLRRLELPAWSYARLECRLEN